MIDHPYKTPNPLAGGIFIALAPIAGAIIGGLQGQPTIGLLVGFSLGVVIALAIWLVDRTKGRT